MRKRTAVLTITFLSAAVIALGAFAWSSAVKAKKLEYYAKANTQRAFTELVTDMNELSHSLQKSVFVSDPALESALCTQVFGRAMTAQQSLGVIPFASQELENTANFVSRVGDFACTLSRSVGAEGGYSEEELNSLLQLSDTAGVLAQNLTELQQQVLSGELTMADVYRAQDGAGAQEQTPTAGTAFKSIEETFPALPTLLYDGPFSDSRTTGQTKLLDGRKDVDAGEACKAASAFLSVPEGEMTAAGESGGDTPCWICEAKINGGVVSVYVTKKGGVILSALNARTPGETNISQQDALAAAAELLNRYGLENMKESYHVVQGNVLTVNYISEQDGVLCYPDMVKLGIAMDNGTLMSYDAHGYVASHTERAFPAVAFSREDAVALAEKTLTVEKTDLALIPSAGGEERLCHELLCTGRDDTRCLLYVNAQSGVEEKILLLLEDDNGTLTI